MPDLDISDIQGLILRGFSVAFQRHIVLRVEDPPEARRLLGRFVDGGPALQVTSAAPWTAKPAATLTLGITAEGLKALGLPQETLDSFPAEFLRGPSDPLTAQRVGNIGESAPENWLPAFAPGPDRSAPAHLLLFVAAVDAAALDEASSGVADMLTATHAFSVLTVLDGTDLPGSRVHFGFLDGLSQPRIAGGPAKDMADDQPPAPPGEFLLGYESQLPGFSYPVPVPAELGRNGTFGAYGVLKQDVDAFEKFLSKAAGDIGKSEAWVAARICGRWRNGVPLALSPDSDSPDPPMALEQLNRFDYVPTVDNPDVFDDSRGVRCPVGAHIRRCNPRSGRVEGDSGHMHRLLRRGIPYGPAHDPARPDDGIDRGLLGMFLCVSLRDQFEFIMAEWVNGDAFGLLGDRDPLVGDNDSGRQRLRIPTVEPPGHITVTGLKRFITTRGSAYCFLPSITAIRYMSTLQA